MSEAERRDHWQDVYATKADDAFSWYQQSPAPSLEMIDRCGLANDARIVDVGGGSSRLVDALLERGFTNLSVLDVSSLALERAAQRLGQRADAVEWITADVTGWHAEQQFDLWHDRAAFHFLVDAAQRAAYKAALRGAIGRGGFAIIATFALDGPEKCSGLPVQRYGPAELAVELADGFTPVDSLEHAHQTPWGKVQQFQFSRFRRD